MNTISSQTEEKSFREQISEFMDEYSKSIGFAEGFTSSLVSDSILTTIEDTIKSNKYAQHSVGIIFDTSQRPMQMFNIKIINIGDFSIS